MKVDVTYDVEEDKPVLSLEAETEGENEVLSLLATGQDFRISLTFDNGENGEDNELTN